MYYYNISKTLFDDNLNTIRFYVLYSVVNQSRFLSNAKRTQLVRIYYTIRCEDQKEYAHAHKTENHIIA